MWEAFSNFLVEHLKWTLGSEWFHRELAKLAEERDEPMKLLVRFHDFVSGLAKKEGLQAGDRLKTSPSGDALALMTLAHDLYSLRSQNRLQQRLINRLINRQQFQGARYEAAIAATFIRSGCRVDWMSQGPGRRCEFIATHLDTAERVAVETKSRVREGVLGQPGRMDADDVGLGDVEALIDRALEQAPAEAIPFMIFVDANCPPTQVPPGAVSDYPWARPVDAHMKALAAGTPEDPYPFTALAVTNFSYHYRPDDTTGTSSNALLLIPKCSSRPSPSSRLMLDLWSEVDRYGSVPQPY